MFDIEKIKLLNELEMLVYQYVIENMSLTSQLTIRELAINCHVSTSTVLRFCTKLGFEGFSDFKYSIKRNPPEQIDTLENYYSATMHLDSFFKKMTDESFKESLEPAVSMIVESQYVIFSGIGTSGILGSYGSRYFANLGIQSFSIADPFSPVPTRGMENSLAIILSVSGETKELVQKVMEFKQNKVKVLSITNNERSTIARLADHNLSYYMPEEHSTVYDPAINLTTQVPVIVLIEILAHYANKKIENKKTSK